jgi:alkylation response protein AidB-like acyl-CoA dehydrogenase
LKDLGPSSRQHELIALARGLARERLAPRADRRLCGQRAEVFRFSAGCARYYATPAIRLGDEPWIERTLYLQIPKDTPGVSFPGDWDPMGMRATVSRDMLLQNVFVADDAEVLPPGLFGATYNAFPHLFVSFSATFLGLMQAAYDDALAYLSGRLPGAPIPHTAIAAKGQAIAEMLFAIESARAIYYRAISEAEVDPPLEAVQRARAAHVIVQRAVVAVTQEAIRVCGGRACRHSHAHINELIVFLGNGPYVRPHSSRTVDRTSHPGWAAWGNELLEEVARESNRGLEHTVSDKLQ